MCYQKTLTALYSARIHTLVVRTRNISTGKVAQCYVLGISNRETIPAFECMLTTLFSKRKTKIDTLDNVRDKREENAERMVEKNSKNVWNEVTITSNNGLNTKTNIAARTDVMRKREGDAEAEKMEYSAIPNWEQRSFEENTWRISFVYNVHRWICFHIGQFHSQKSFFFLAPSISAHTKLFRCSRYEFEIYLRRVLVLAHTRTSTFVGWHKCSILVDFRGENSQNDLRRSTVSSKPIS